MAYILLSLGALTLLAALALLLTDSRPAKPAPLDDAPSTAPDTGARPEPEPDADLSAEEDEPAVVEPLEVEPVELDSAPREAVEGGPTRPEPVEPVAAEIPGSTEEDEAGEPVEPAEPEPQAEPITLRKWEPPAEETETEPEPEPAPAPRPHRRSGLQLPGASRRERRAWAERNNFEFAKQDEFLNGEWSRGAAASGAVAKDIASGLMYGHDTFVMDLGGVTVMAMRTGEVSDVVVDMRRRGFSADSSADLVEIGEAEGFTVHATEVGPAQRFLDIRVRTALERLPAAVTAVWFESEWVLAETGHGTSPAEWDAMLAPLALLADAARVLPPQTWQVVVPEYPTREMGERIDAGVEVDKREEPAPKVQRPEEPLELPTRATGAVRGVMDHRAVGGDEVEAIADGAARDDASGDLTRVRRDQTPPSIFGD